MMILHPVEDRMTPPLAQLIDRLPEEYQNEVKDFVEFLLLKKVNKSEKKLRQDWAGALKEFNKQYTSMDLQKKALEWRGD